MVKFILRLISLAEGDMGGGAEHRNTAKEINEHRITARKVDETPSPLHTVRFEITATPEIEILFTASKKHQHCNTANVPISLLAVLREVPHVCFKTDFKLKEGISFFKFASQRCP